MGDKNVDRIRANEIREFYETNSIQLAVFYHSVQEMEEKTFFSCSVLELVRFRYVDIG